MGDRQHPHKLPITAAVLAGGRSARMGFDKTLLDMEGQTLVARVTTTALSVCERAVVVTNRPDAMEAAGLPSGGRVLVDEVPYLGPLGGLVTALARTEDEWVLAVAADMPWLEPAIISVLWDLRGDADVVIPVGKRGPEPLLALYRTSTCLPAARTAIEAGFRRLVEMFPFLEVVEVPEDVLRTADPGLRSLVNVNTPEDLAQVRAQTRDSGVAGAGDPLAPEAPGVRHDLT